MERMLIQNAGICAAGAGVAALFCWLGVPFWLYLVMVVLGVTAWDALEKKRAEAVRDAVAQKAVDKVLQAFDEEKKEKE